MIDDFVRRPGKHPKLASKLAAQAEDFLPDLSKPAIKQDTQPAKADDTFLTPKQAASEDPDDDVIDMSQPGTETNSVVAKPRVWHRIAIWFRGLNKKQKTALIFAIILVLAGSCIAAFAALGNKEIANVKTAPVVAVEPPKPTTVPSALTGLQVEPAINEKPVIGVIIENSTNARPQSGLYDAGVVFEAIAEGGVTRFLALYQDTAPESIGPVRSVRPYYLDWAAGFDAPIAHVGGSPEALKRIKGEGIKDLDQFFNSAYYQRVSGKYAPHNVYTSIAKLNQAAVAKSYGKSNFTGFARKDDAASKQPTAKTANINISSQRYNVQYTYDSSSNSYARNLAGAAHMDEKAAKQIKPKVVVAMVIPYRIHSDGKHSVYGTIGNGQVYIFQDGDVTIGTWQKASAAAQITFTDQAGQPIKLNAGQTWISMVAAANKVTYAP